MTTDKMESERGDTGGRTRTVFVETGLETTTFAEALARRDAPTPDIGVPARTAGGGYAYAAWLARAERLAGTCDRPGSAWLKSAILRALPAGSQTERKAIRWARMVPRPGSQSRLSLHGELHSAQVAWAGGKCPQVLRQSGTHYGRHLTTEQQLRRKGSHGPSNYPTPLPLYFVFDPYHANPHRRRSSL